MQFLTGLSLATWLKIGVGVALAALLWSWNSRGNTIDDLRSDLAEEVAKHDITRASVIALETELANQNAEIERQRVATDQAKRDLAQAVEASAGSVDIIDRLTKSSRSAPAGLACEPSETVRSIWR